MTGRPTNQFDGELAALRHQREIESLGDSTLVDDVLDGVAHLAEKTGLPVLPGLFRKALKSGRVPVEEMVDRLEAAAFEEIRRIWEHLNGQKRRQEEFEGRLNSQEAQVASIAAFFHGLRTSDPHKHSRLARLTVNSIFADDLAPENLDSMMRAAVELKDADVILLGNLYKWQNSILSERGMNPQKWHGDIQSAQKNLVNSGVLNPQEHLNYRSSYSRLESLGLIQRITSAGDYGVGFELYALLMEGKRLYERLQEIGART